MFKKSKVLWYSKVAYALLIMSIASLTGCSCNHLPGMSGTTSGWVKACPRIESAMVTPLFAYKDVNQVKSQSIALLKSKNFNAICGLIDQQDGRNRGLFGQPNCYVIKARTKTALTSEGERNLKAVLDAGLTPVLITHNDYAADKAESMAVTIPSLEGPKPNSIRDFYSLSNLANEKAFLSSLSKYYPYIHIQLSIEATAPESAQYCLELAAHLRNSGFKNKIIVNPLGNANSAYLKIKSYYDGLGVVRAQSYHLSVPPEDPIWNTDGYTVPNQSNAKDWITLFRNSGKEYIFHTQELKDCPNGIPAGYLVTAPAAPPAPVIPSTPPALPKNPIVGNDLPGSNSESWYFAKKDGDGTYRIRWPSYFANAMGIGGGSYCFVNNNVAQFRSYDTDNNSKRPSYSISSSINLAGPIVCILCKPDGKAIAWFSTPDAATRTGRLP